jgi:hypothetical protein
MLASDASKVAFRDVTWEWKTSKESNMPDQLRVNFYATFPKAEMGTDDFIQYVEMYPEFDRNETPARDIIGCDYKSGTFKALSKKGVTTDMKATIGSSVSGMYESDDKGWKVETTSEGRDNVDIGIDGQYEVNCTITKDFSKLDRDYGVFMSYKGTGGAGKHDGSGLADWGKSDIKFTLSEPTYDFGEVKDADYIVQPGSISETEVWAEDLDASKEGFGF